MCANMNITTENTTVEIMIECLICHVPTTEHEIRNGICVYCVEELEAEAAGEVCECCGGSGEIVRWVFGVNGGYETFRPCLECSGHHHCD